jgi:hypothetical protein
VCVVFLFSCQLPDGGCFFSVRGPCSYQLGTVAFQDNIIVDCFGVERLEEYRGKGRLDLCLVYGADPMMLSFTPGGRDNAVMVTKATFHALSLPDMDGNYFLRPDRILGAFLFDHRAPPSGLEEAQHAVKKEVELDAATKESIGDLRLSFCAHGEAVRQVFVASQQRSRGQSSASFESTSLNGESADILLQ